MTLEVFAGYKLTEFLHQIMRLIAFAKNEQWKQRVQQKLRVLFTRQISDETAGHNQFFNILGYVFGP